MRKHLWLIAASALMVAPAGALAWGPEGHAIVAEIAESRLTPAAMAQVTQILAQESHEHLDQVSSWADAYRATNGKTGPWHFVDIPLNAPAYDPARDCAGGNCVVAQIQHFARILGDDSATLADRLTALKFVVHFVGDIHQPLHCEDNKDRGGNDVRLTFASHSTNLHAVWDGGIIEDELGVGLGPNYMPDLATTLSEAMKLGAAIVPADAAAWAPPGLVGQLDTATVAWADESHSLAPAVYRNLPDPRPEGWEKPYEAAEWPVIQTQLEKAGVRLAELLNEELDSSGRAARQ